MTATRQAIAHRRGWSLEQLVLDIRLEEAGAEDAFVIEGEFVTRYSHKGRAK